jgi:hypothetical protein
VTNPAAALVGNALAVTVLAVTVPKTIARMAASTVACRATELLRERRGISGVSSSLIAP